MKRFGFIGCGSMGSMLVNGFLSAEALKPDQVIVSNRSTAKLDPISRKWPGIQVTRDNEFVAHMADIVFVCIRPLDVLPVLAEIRNEFRPDTHLVSIAAGVRLRDLESLFAGRITKVIPSLTSEVREGISLICHNPKVKDTDAKDLESILSSISKVIAVDEKDFEIAADLTSCAPGIIASIFRNYVEAGMRQSGLDKETAQEMVIATLYGTAALLRQQQMRFDEMIGRVATKGGITESAIQVLENNLPYIFDELFRRTLEKHEKIKAQVRAQSAEMSWQNVKGR